MPDSVYKHDALEWAETQAALLRRLAAGERVNQAVDWAHIIDEVQDLGLSELRACQSSVRQVFLHLLKLAVWPHSRAARHWRLEVGVFLAGLRRSFTPSMRQRIDLAAEFDDQVRGIRAELVREGRDLADCMTCAVTLEQLLAERPDIEALVQSVVSGISPSA